MTPLPGFAPPGPDPLGVILPRVEQALRGAAPAIIKAIFSPGLSASVATTKLVANADPGAYRISAYADATAAVGATLTVTIAWTDAAGAHSVNIFNAAGISAGGELNATIPIFRATTGPITYAVTIGGTITYDFSLVLERLA